MQIWESSLTEFYIQTWATFHATSNDDGETRKCFSNKQFLRLKKSKMPVKRRRNTFDSFKNGWMNLKKEKKKREVVLFESIVYDGWI